ncbi:MAG TPA: nucleotidyltransferase family protein [Myxococcota bacterium]
MARFAALVLAGRRGAEDPLARSRGAVHKALLDVGGVPMLVRVVRALRESPSIGSITVSIDDPRALEAVPDLKAALAAGDLRVHRSLDSPSRSVSDALSGRTASEPVLVTTADHALLTREIVEYFAEAAASTEADLWVGVVSRSSLDARYPETTRTYLRLRGERWTGANLFCFRSDLARRAAAFWVRAEQQRKRPWRLAWAFGPRALLLFLLRRLDLDAALERASRAIGARIGAIRLPFPEAAIDVDRPSDLALVERILAERAAHPTGG